MSNNESRKITPREESFSDWYHDIIRDANLAEHSPTRGSMIIKPNGYAIWENIQKELDRKFKDTGVRNAYFPLLIPEKFLEKEKDHVEGFSPEVAVVTHAGGKELPEKYIIRPTSETIIYDAFSRWIESYRDLPLLINQWANVMRWEMRPRLFLRTSEFLWQEGHTAHRTLDEADERARLMLEVYKNFIEEYLAIPVIAGEKSESERFAGADRTYTIEAMMQDGKALQAGTSHNLGKNFSVSFDVTYLDDNGENKHVFSTSWGVSTRLIGALIMVHSDDKGLVLPPKVSSTEAVLMPIWKDESDKKEILSYAEEAREELKKEGIRAEVDTNEKTIGEKHYRHEKEGVPVRIEVGGREMEGKKLVVVRRDKEGKETVDLEGAGSHIKAMLEDMQKALFEKAEKWRDENTEEAENWSDFKKYIKENKFVYAHWDGTAETEAKINEETKATVRCIPFDMKKETGACVYSGKESKGIVLFAKNY